MSRQPPSDFPPGLWETICSVVQDPAQFFQDNPELYEELKAEWREAPKKLVGRAEGLSGPTPPPTANALAQDIRDSAERITGTPRSPYRDLHERMLNAAAAIEDADFLTGAGHLCSATTILLDLVLNEKQSENAG